VVKLLLGTMVLNLVSCGDPLRDRQTASVGRANPRNFAAKGVVTELKPDGHTVVIRHEEITNYMAAMTMPFRVVETNELAGLKPGDEITFRLYVTGEESWIDHVIRVRRTSLDSPLEPTNAPAPATPKVFNFADIPEFSLTNEFGLPVSLHRFQGRAVALTFFFTRCPIPEYCPRLTKNFQGAIERLKAVPGGATNFVFLSISFDPIDTPMLLRAYARQYRYDSNHWSFLTGHPEQIRELARGFGVPISAEGATYTHGFRTAIFDTNGSLQAIWPVGGDMTDQIVAEITKALQTHKP
jgi:protein SCO1/2